MARTYHVQRAQRRYETKPVLGPDGVQLQTPKMRNGQQMTSKYGRLVFMKVTERDLDRPKPMPTCSRCSATIEVGMPYKYTETYNRTIVRCAACPVPQVWEYSSSLSARVAEIIYNAENDDGDPEEMRDNLATAVRELADEKEESAQNMEDGFGHETGPSQELRDIAEQLSSWADDIEQLEIPGEPEPEETECEECDGDDPECKACLGSGRVTPESPTDEQMEDWRSEAREAVLEAAGECPV